MAVAPARLEFARIPGRATSGSRSSSKERGWKQIFRTLGTGVPGSMMKPFTTLSVDDRWGLAYYVLELKAGGL